MRPVIISRTRDGENVVLSRVPSPAVLLSHLNTQSATVGRGQTVESFQTDPEVGDPESLHTQPLIARDAESSQTDPEVGT